MRRLPDVRRGPFILESNLSRIVDEMFRDFDTVGSDIAPGFGRTDVYEKDKSLIFETELPGVKKEDVAIRIEDEQLIISGETKRSEEIDREHYFRMGRQYGRFQRSFPLPAELVEKGRVQAKFEDGILRVTAPLKESIKEREKAVLIPVG